MSVPALLALADGTVFRGQSIGAQGSTSGEVVFNTALTGYQEILTDPSYARQIVTLTCPHIGNTGVNGQDMESSRIHAAGLIIRDLPVRSSSFREQEPLQSFLAAQGLVGIAGIDTRKLTRVLRDRGAQAGAIAAGPDADPAQAVALARAFPGLAGMDLARSVTTGERYLWNEGVLWPPREAGEGPPAPRLHVVAYDFGIKRNILRMLAEHGCRVTVVPAQTSAAEALSLKPDGILLSNGPGDPEPCHYAIEAAARFIDQGLPVFGICLGHQILGLAAGGRTLKMKFGHHGANHPVLELDSGRVYITSQNHGFAVDEKSLPAGVRVTHRSLFDGTLQGLAFEDRPVFGFQGHPEASPGPHDVRPLFARFRELMLGAPQRADERSAEVPDGPVDGSAPAGRRAAGRT